MVDWKNLRAAAGDHVCPDHGLTAPIHAVVPACPECGRALFVAVRRKGAIHWTAPAPTHCAGPEHHRFKPGEILLGWTPCQCVPGGGHARWTCRACGNVQRWPPCSRPSEQFAPPLTGPRSPE